MAEYRTIDGSNNNLEHPEWGMAEQPLLRNTTPAYEGRSEPSGSNRPNPRLISNEVCSQPKPVANKNGLSDFMWAWGQFLDHELDLSRENEHETLQVFPPDNEVEHPDKFIPFARSTFHPQSGTDISNPRQQINALSAFIDGANVYGTDPVRAGVLREFDGTGKLKVTKVKGERPLLPKNPGGVPQPGFEKRDPTKFFMAGDIRCNEHVVLTCMHTLFVREHNRLCDDLKKKAKEATKEGKESKKEDKFKDDEAIYQHARKIVGGLMQAITYNEFLPALLGENSVAPESRYNQNVNPGIANIFSTGCYRLGHSMLSPKVKRVGDSALPFQDTFWKPELVEEKGIDPFLAGLATQTMQELDTKAVDDIRSFLFHDHENPDVPSKAFFDLAALNILRGRDHGLPDYNQCRADYGLPRKESFSDISKNRDTQKRLETAYDNVDLIDPWIGGLAEDHHGDAIVGEFFFHVLKDQFDRLRDGDRFWFSNDLDLSEAEREEIRNTTLSKVILRNTDITAISDDVFRVAAPPKRRTGKGKK